MNTDKTAEEKEVTPSKKKLKQARLPFKVISDVSPTPLTPQTRKRKHSDGDVTTTPKIGRLSKENDAIEAVVISDDDSKDASKEEKSEKSLNPYVKMVALARKKKQVKGKKKNAKKISKKISLSSIEKDSSDTGDEKNKDTVEMMDVDDPAEVNVEDKQSLKNSEGDNRHTQNGVDKTPINSSKTMTRSSIKSNSSDNSISKSPSIVSRKKSQSPKDKQIKKITRSSSKATDSQNEVLVLEDSNNSSDVKTLNGVKENSVSPKKPETESKSPVKNNKEDFKLVTPKRSSRNKTKVESTSDLNTSVSSKLNDSLSSEPTTPKQSRSSSVTNSLDDSMKEISGTDKLTPRQMQKKLESAKKREEREKEKFERDQKKQQEKEEKNKQRLEKEEQRKKEREEKEEAKKKEKEQKEDLKRKEKEEKEKQKELEKKMREEKEELKKKEREEKEEQKRKEKEAREEEKRKKQEALELEKQEQELKKKKAAEAFVNFFVPKQKSEKDASSVGPTPISKSSILTTFTIKSDMRLAPLVRVNLTDERKETFDEQMLGQNLTNDKLYLRGLKECVPGSCGKTWPLSDKDDDDVMIIEDELPPMETAGEEISCESIIREKLRPKLFSFHENRRPPYWGTWRKKSALVKPRNPFGREKILDYEVDSDEDWESDQEGESIGGSAAGSDDEQGPDEYELDNQVFVPHGYLSDEEGTMDGDDMLSLSPETQKARLKHLEDEFETELKKPTEKLKPRMFGILWENEEGGKPDNCVDALWNYFGKLRMVMSDIEPLMKPAPVVEDTEKKVKKRKQVEGDQSPKTEAKKKSKVEKKEPKKTKPDKKNTQEVKKNQLGINSFLTKASS